MKTAGWLAVAAIACIADLGMTAGTAGGAEPRVETTPNLVVTSLALPEGTIRVRLPADMAAGDTISGTVVAEPSGGTDAERAANASALNGYVVDTGTAKSGAGRRVLTFVLPAGAAALTLTILRARGDVAARSALPVKAQQTSFGRPPQPADYHFPQVATPGRPLRISGPFSGDIAQTTLAIGGTAAELIAESPRTLVTAPAPGVTGPSAYRLEEHGLTVSAPCNVVSLALTAPSTKLAKGEHTVLSVAVAGLEGIREPVRLQLLNATPDVVSVAGGPSQLLTIAPSDVRGGTYRTDRDVTGLRAGSFSLNALLDEQAPPLVDGGPVFAGTPAPATVAKAAPCTWKAASIDTTRYGVDTKDDLKLKALQKAASALVSKLAPAAANIVAALPAVFGQVSKQLVEVYITYVCIDPAGNVVATKVVHLSDLEALDWSAPDASSFNSPDRKTDRLKDVMRNTPH